MIYGSTTYLFEKNLQGDVIAMWTSGGSKVASYVYDAWGNIISESVSSAHQTASELNPFRYRGYYYDTETGFYYLQSRYYDPATGRFLNADGYINANGDLQGFNMYAYCSNNPVMYRDDSGESILAAVIFIGVSALIGGGMGAFTAAATGGNVWEGAIEGFVLGGFAATVTVLVPYFLPTIGAIAQTGITIGIAGAGGFGLDLLTQYLSYEYYEQEDEFSFDLGRAFKTGFTTAISSAIPTFGKPSASYINSIGSLIIGFDASAINAVVEIILSNLFS